MDKPAAPTVREVMTPSPASIPMNATLTEAREMMRTLRVNHLPVMDGDLVESIISNTDIERFLLPGHRLRKDEEPLVRDICPARAYVADVSDPLDKVLEVMIDRHLSAIIALEDGDLAGIFTETDTCRLLLALIEEKIG